MPGQNGCMNKTAIITGATGLIGRAISFELLDKGYTLILIARDEHKLLELAAEILKKGGQVQTVAIDLSNIEKLGRNLKAVERFGSYQVLVNCAGVFDWSCVECASQTSWDTLFDINLRSVFHLTHYLLPMLDRSGDGAFIINLSSIAGKEAIAGGSLYCATKSALFAFGACLYEELRDDNIRVCTLGPGQVAHQPDTELTTKIAVIPPEDLAKAVGHILDFPATLCPVELLLRPR